VRLFFAPHKCVRSTSVYGPAVGGDRSGVRRSTSGGEWPCYSLGDCQQRRPDHPQTATKSCWWPRDVIDRPRPSFISISPGRPHQANDKLSSVGRASVPAEGRISLPVEGEITQVRRLVGRSVLNENPAAFLDDLGMVLAKMGAMNDELGTRSVKVCAVVRNDAIASTLARRVAEVGHDGVEFHRRIDSQVAELQEERMRPFQLVDAG
jgi:hypothetical protein